MESKQDQAITAIKPRNRFDRSELAGAFGDLGTLIPFVVAYIGVLKMDAFGVLLPFGLGGALILLGTVLSVTALLFSGSVGVLLHLFPTAILGVILFLTGAQLALGACDISKDKGERFVLVITAALAVWNVGIAFVVGMVAYALNKRGLLRV